MRYAHYVQAGSDPAPVRGWYDTEALAYAELPEPRIEVPAEVWDRRMTGRWVVLGGQLVVEPASPQTVSPEQQRSLRDQALSGSDWTQLADAPLTDAARDRWTAYRQALRDWPLQTGWPDIALPAAPA